MKRLAAPVGALALAFIAAYAPVKPAAAGLEAPSPASPTAGAQDEAPADAGAREEAAADARTRAFPPIDSLSIERCMQLARELAPEVRAAASDRAAAAFEASAAARNRRPALSLGASALIAPRGWYDPAITNLGEYRLGPILDWPLLDGGARRRARARAMLGDTTALNELARSRRDAARSAAQLAVTLLSLEERQRTAQGVIERLSRFALRTAAGVRAGVRSRDDELRLNLERESVAATSSQIAQELEETRRELARWIGLPPDHRFAVRGPDSTDERGPLAADSVALERAAERAPEIQSARLAQAEGRLALEEALRLGAVQLDLRADAGLAGTNTTTLVPEDLRAQNPSASFADRLRRDAGAELAIDFKAPLADPTLGSARNARRAALDAARVRHDLALADARRAVRDVLARWRAAAARFAAAEATLNAAEENTLRRESLYVGGVGTLLEWLDAQRVLDDTLDRLTGARAEVRAARFEAEALR